MWATRAGKIWWHPTEQVTLFSGMNVHFFANRPKPWELDVHQLGLHIPQPGVLGGPGN